MDPKEKIVLTMANVLVRNTLVDLIVMNARLVTAWMVSQHVRSVFFLFFVHLQKILSYSKYIVLHENCKKMGCKLNVSFPGTQYHGTGFCQGQVHTVTYRTSARRDYSFKLQSLQKIYFLAILTIWKNWIWTPLGRK